MHIDKIRQLVGWMTAANLTRLELRAEGFELSLKRVATATVHLPHGTPSVPHAPSANTEVTRAVAAMATVCGHFHARHPSRDTAQVALGQTVALDDIVGVIAVGELLLPVKASRAGIAAGYLVEDGSLVDYATPLLALASE